MQASALLAQRSPLSVFPAGALRDGEIEALGAVELGVNEPGSEDAAIQIDDLVGRQMALVEGFLIIQNLTGLGVNP